MNRTVLSLGAAGLLALVALVANVPRPTHAPSPSPTSPDPQPPTAGPLTLETRLSHPTVFMGTSDVFLAVDVKAREMPDMQRAPVNLALVIDRSGSMSGPKLQQAKAAARQLVAQLTSADRLALVHYGSDVKSMSSTLCTPANKEALFAFIDGIIDDGGTNIGAGLSRAQLLLVANSREYRVNRVILISDGQPTEGLTGDDQLKGVAQQMRQAGLSLSSIGVGTDFNEALMESFAELGGGAYAYLEDAAQLSHIFARDLAAAGTQVAKQVGLTLSVSNATVEEVLGYSNVQRSGSSINIRLPDFSAGQRERVVLHLKVSAQAAGQAVDVATARLDYQDVLADRPAKAAATVAALVSASSEEVAQRRDKEAVVFAARARSAQNTRAAAEALRGGNKEQARQLMQANQVYFREAAEVAGPNAVAGDLNDNAAFEQRLSSASNDEEVRAFSKDSRRKARIDFGLIGSTY
jgi:Ca-activated chloride channel homolog